MNQKKEQKHHGSFLKRKKKWLYSASILAALSGAVIMTDQLVTPTSSDVAYALTLPTGSSQVGTINGAPVIKSPTDDMASQTFQDIISGLLEGTGNPPYIINQASWGSSTSLAGGAPLSSISSAATTIFGADGFLPSDHAVEIPVGQKAMIYNVGTAIKTDTKELIPISLGITVNSATEPDGTPLTKVIMGAKSQSSVITLAWGSVVRGGSNTGGGQTEGGGIGGGSADGTLMAYIESISYTLTFVNSATGQPIPNEALMPIKNSDIDAYQLATMDGNGAKGYILSPDTALTQQGNGFKSTSNGTLNNDSSDLTSNSYVVLKQFNSNLVQYQYTDGAHNHLDIVTGHFGDTPFKVSELLGGYIEIDKSTKQFGKDLWNPLYSFDKISFDILDKDGKTVGTIGLNAQGKGKSERIPQGTYTLREKSSNWTSTGQTIRPDLTVTVKAGDTVTTSPKNVAVTGEITIKKTGVESGGSVWNENYTLAGNNFLLTSKTDGKTYTITTDKTGTAVKNGLPLGEYEIEEVGASQGFINTFKPQTVVLTYKDNKTEVIFAEKSGTNQEVKGQTLLQKIDKKTGLEQNGKADLKTAKYQLLYNEESSGFSKHKKGDPVKWTDKPTPKLLTGTKVTSALVGGKTVEFGEAIVIDVDDTKLQAAVSNLALGKYKWVEVDAGVGYVTDPTEHTFEIKYKDEKTETVIAEDKTSKEVAIEAAIKINKMVTLPDSQGGSGYNDIEFTGTPLEGTIAEPVIMTTGVDPVTGDDGFALGNLVYGDWKIEETSGVEGYEDIKPIYIHMETDTKTDILTISASYYDDFSRPFSTRKFALQDSSTEKNPNSSGTVGSVSPAKPTISLSTLHFNDNPEKEVPPTPPTKDVTKVDGGESINDGNVALASDFVYALNSSVLQKKRKDTTSWMIDDDFDETFDRFNGTFKLYATTDFDSFKTGDELPNTFVKAEEKDGNVLFTAQKEFLDVVNKHKNKPVGFTIHADFYRFKDSDKVVNTFVEAINELKQESNEVNTKTPKPQPHKFDLSAEKVDLTGDKLLDDDSEMKDRYEDSNKDPYVDKADNNEKENLNTAEVKIGQTLFYQLWLDTTPFDETSELTVLRMVDKYDAASLTLDLEKVNVYNAKGEDVTKNFKIEDDKGTLTVSANVFKKAKNSKGEEVSIVDTEAIPLNQFYKIDAPMTVKDEVKPGTDIINTASQEWTDSEGTENSHITEKRVNKVPGAAPPKEEKTPVEKVAQAVLPNTGDSLSSLFLKLAGWILFIGIVALKRDVFIQRFRRTRRALKK